MSESSQLAKRARVAAKGKGHKRTAAAVEGAARPATSLTALVTTTNRSGKDPFALHLAVLAGGALVKEITSLARRLGLSDEELGRRCGLSRATLHRRLKANAALAPMEADVWSRFALLLNQAIDVFEDEQAAQSWLRTAQPGLSDQIPLDLAQSTTGYREVEKLLTRIDRGVYV